MKLKTMKITYWIVTALFAAFMLFGGITNAMQIESAVEGMKALGYPAYLLTIIGIAKIAGSIALLQNKFKTIKEWAYAGFAIDIVGASASFALNGDGIGMTLAPLIFLAVLFVSYGLWKKIEAEEN